MAVDLRVNGEDYTLEVEGDTPLLWVLRDEVGLKGTKFGCGAGLCGACTVHLNGAPVRSCSTPVDMAAGSEVTTIEGLGQPGKLHELQQAWVDHGVPQCGYCQSGQIMSAAHLLQTNPAPTRDEIVAAMTGNICRCGTYSRIVAAVESVVGIVEPSMQEGA
ncbi:(2Fe-2S)-binding protein [Marinobacter salinexigens]|uniref:(2Fe-2S)-binding protein n=1 Tax=Marinobacter salinexigens TaxID=2919747 RepID=A0A5B0VI96_9GAMM|nr:(2Fe-2S)-binding protein [Marinobacter salinexigens]KAA1173701.1 (2Fe-2S)-binding protein [Marinobacter salinexigens]